MRNNQNPNQKQNQNKNQNQQQQQQQQQQNQNPNAMNEEFGSETNVEEVKKQVQQSEANKRNASGTRANQFENGSR